MVCHVIRMPQERLLKQAWLAKANGKRPFGWFRTKWTNYVEDLGWNRLGLHPSEMMETMEDRKCGGLISSCCFRNPNGKAGHEDRKRILYWFKTMKFEWFSGIYKQNCDNCDTMQLLRIAQTTKNFLAFVQINMLAFPLSQFYYAAKKAFVK